MLDFTKYKNQLDFPTKPSRKHAPKMLDFEKKADWGAATDAWEEAHAKDMRDYRKGVQAYSQESAHLTEVFWKDLGRDLGWNTSSEKALQALQSYAWDKGHYAGFSEVYAVATGLSDIADVISGLTDQLEDAAHG